MDIFEKCEEVFGLGSNEWMRLNEIRDLVEVRRVRHLNHNLKHIFLLTRSTSCHNLEILINECTKSLLFAYGDKDEYASTIVDYDSFAHTLKGASE